MNKEFEHKHPEKEHGKRAFCKKNIKATIAGLNKPKKRKK